MHKQYSDMNPARQESAAARKTSRYLSVWADRSFSAFIVSSKAFTPSFSGSCCKHHVHHSTSEGGYQVVDNIIYMKFGVFRFRMFLLLWMYQYGYGFTKLKNNISRTPASKLALGKSMNTTQGAIISS